MTVQIKTFDGEKVRLENYKGIYRGVNLAELREKFFAYEQTRKWGVMVQLKGKERIVLGRFGTHDDD